MPVVPLAAELFAVQRQVLVAEVVKYFVDAALEQGEEGLGGAGVYVARRVVDVAVLDDGVPAIDVVRDASVGGEVVRDDSGRGIDAVPNLALKPVGRQPAHRLRPGLAVALHHRRHGRLPLRTPAGVLLVAGAAHVRLVHLSVPFKHRRQRLRLHGGANPAHYVPRRPVKAQVQVALQLLRTDALLGGARRCRP